MSREFIHHLDPVAWARDRFGFIADTWQEQVLRHHGDLHVLCSRQSGKTTTSALRALYECLVNDNYTVVIISPTLRQSLLMSSKIGDLLRQLPEVKLLTDSMTILRFENGSVIHSLPGGNEDTVRGFSADLLIEDESSRVSDSVYVSCRPFLAATGGFSILQSTPLGKLGHFYDIGTGDDPGWQRIVVPATECKRISAEFLSREQKVMSDWQFRQEYMCEWGEVENAVFRAEDLAKIFSDDDGDEA
jgi:hypothetical protein